MSTEPLPPEPEQIVPPAPPSRGKLVVMATGIAVVLVAGVLVLRGYVFQPSASSDANVTALPLRGNPKAPLTIFEYASLGCEHCAKVQPILKEVLSRYDGKVKLVYIHSPLGRQENATRAALAGVCASEQGKFWEFEHIMFERQSSWLTDAKPDALWMLYASQVGLDTNLFQKCLASESTSQAVQQQLMMGAGQMVQQTPTFLIGGSRLVNPETVADFARVIDKELAALKK